MADFGWSYPPGVTGNEPQITGEWPCRVCQGAGYDDENEDGKHACSYCRGTGIDPEEPPYCLNCGNIEYDKLWENVYTGETMCDACKDIQPDEEKKWQTF